MRIEETISIMDKEVGVKRKKLKLLKGKVLHYNWENDLLEREIKNRKEQIKNLKVKCKTKDEIERYNENEQLSIKFKYRKKIAILERVLKKK